MEINNGTNQELAPKKNKELKNASVVTVLALSFFAYLIFGKIEAGYKMWEYALTIFIIVFSMMLFVITAFFFFEVQQRYIRYAGISLAAMGFLVNFIIVATLPIGKASISLDEELVIKVDALEDDESNFFVKFEGYKNDSLYHIYSCHSNRFNIKNDIIIREEPLRRFHVLKDESRIFSGIVLKTRYGYRTEMYPNKLHFFSN